MLLFGIRLTPRCPQLPKSPWTYHVLSPAQPSFHALQRLQIRTSYGMFVPRYQDATIAAISERVAKWTGLPIINQEAMQVGSLSCHGSHLPFPFTSSTRC